MAEKTSDEKGGKNVRKELKESAQRIWLAGLGALSVAEEEGSKAFNSLVERGQDWEARSKERVEEVRSKARSQFEGRFEGFEEMIDERITDTLHRFGVPTRDEIHALSDRIAELTEKIEALRGDKGSGSSS